MPVFKTVPAVIPNPIEAPTGASTGAATATLKKNNSKLSFYLSKSFF